MCALSILPNWTFNSSACTIKSADVNCRKSSPLISSRNHFIASRCISRAVNRRAQSIPSSHGSVIAVNYLWTLPFGREKFQLVKWIHCSAVNFPKVHRPEIVTHSTEKIQLNWEETLRFREKHSLRGRIEKENISHFHKFSLDSQCPKSYANIGTSSSLGTQSSQSWNIRALRPPRINPTNQTNKPDHPNPSLMGNLIGEMDRFYPLYAVAMREF